MSDVMQPEPHNVRGLATTIEALEKAVEALGEAVQEQRRNVALVHDLNDRLEHDAAAQDRADRAVDRLLYRSLVQER
jgi:outer membrane murein-binding lipoprotein Lpp